MVDLFLWSAICITSSKSNPAANRFDKTVFLILCDDFAFGSDNILGQKFSEACDYAYETEKEEAGEPDISKEELENTVKEEIKSNIVGKAEIENSQFKTKYYKVIIFIFTNVILPLLLNLVYDLGKA